MKCNGLARLFAVLFLKQSNNLYVNWRKLIIPLMKDTNLKLDQFPQVSNRGIIQLVPTKLFVDWFNYVNIDGITNLINDIEPISFLINDFETKHEFDDGLKEFFAAYPIEYELD
jgi:hypothetical protein